MEFRKKGKEQVDVSSLALSEVDEDPEANGKKEHRRGGAESSPELRLDCNITTIVKVLVGIFILYLIISALIASLSTIPSRTKQQPPKAVEVKPEDDEVEDDYVVEDETCTDLTNTPVTIVLYQGQSPGETIRWNTGVWPGFGRLGSFVIEWSGIRVEKDDNSVCKRLPNCDITEDLAFVDDADAVLLEVVNHYQFYGGRAKTLLIDFPLKKPDQLFINFHFENDYAYPDLFTPSVQANFDMQMIPSQHADIPITLTCPWTNDYDDFLKPPPKEKKQDVSAIYFSYGSETPGRDQYVRALLQQMKIDIYGGSLTNKKVPFEKFKGNWVHEEIKLIGSYKFALVFEFINKTDWVTFQLSQALLAGAIPVYMGADNINDYLPGLRSAIKVSDFKGPKQLAAFLNAVARDDAYYDSYFKWKDGKQSWRDLEPSFVKQLEHCVYYAECRLCEAVARERCKRRHQKRNP